MEVIRPIAKRLDMEREVAPNLCCKLLSSVLSPVFELFIYLIASIENGTQDRSDLYTSALVHGPSLSIMPVRLQGLFNCNVFPLVPVFIDYNSFRSDTIQDILRKLHHMSHLFSLIKAPRRSLL